MQIIASHWHCHVHTCRVSVIQYNYAFNILYIIGFQIWDVGYKLEVLYLVMINMMILKLDEFKFQYLYFKMKNFWQNTISGFWISDFLVACYTRLRVVGNHQHLYTMWKAWRNNCDNWLVLGVKNLYFECLHGCIIDYTCYIIVCYIVHLRENWYSTRKGYLLHFLMI